MLLTMTQDQIGIIERRRRNGNDVSSLIMHWGTTLLKMKMKMNPQRKVKKREDAEGNRTNDI